MFLRAPLQAATHPLVRREAFSPKRDDETSGFLENRESEAGELGVGFHAADILWPILLEFSVADFQVLDGVNVMKQKVVARAGLKEFLLNRQPGSFVNPHLNLDDLVADLV